MSAWSASFSMNMLILFPSRFMQRALFCLPSTSMLSVLPSSCSSEISWLESRTWDENRAYSTIFSGSFRSIVAEVAFRIM